MPGKVILSEFLPLVQKFNPVRNRLTCRHRHKCDCDSPQPASQETTAATTTTAAENTAPAAPPTPRSPAYATSTAAFLADPVEKAWRKLVCLIFDALRDFPDAHQAATAAVNRLYPESSL